MTIVAMDPGGPLIVHPLMPHQLQDDVTTREGLFTLCHFGVARVDSAAWRLTIEGLVERPWSASLEDLGRFAQVEIESIHQCQGSPMDPDTPTRRIANVRFGGVRLSELLSRAGPLPGGRFVWAYGADFGSVGPARCDSYLKDFPIERLSNDVLIATHLNGQRLTSEHGAPARLFVPGFYGTNSVKWITRIVIAAERAESLFTTRFYTDPIRGDDGQPTGERRPVWAIAPESVIVAPAPEDSVARNDAVLVWGRAWADEGVARVEVSADDGRTWTDASIESRSGHRWQRFNARWTPVRSGTHVLMSRAWTARGECQPMSGRRNAVHAVTVQAH